MRERSMVQMWLSMLMVCLFFLTNLPAQTLVNPNSTEGTKKLKAYLDTVVYKKKILSGQAFEGVKENWLDIIDQASGGKQPAMISLDFLNTCPDRVKTGSDPDAMTDKAIDWVMNKGGIVEFHWHWDAPSKVNPGGESQAFYTKNTTFSIKTAMANDTNADYKLLIRDMDIIANQLSRLQDSGISIIWRPLHESEGAWFWWGTDGPSCVKLYNLMFDRFTNYHHLNNLIWVWNSYASLESKPYWYPGNDKADIIAYDYENSGSWAAFQNKFGAANKLFALGESGMLPDPNNFAARPWLYFNTWAYMIKDPSIKDGKNTAAWINSVYNDSRVITLDDLHPGPKAKAGRTLNIMDLDDNKIEKVLLDGSSSTTDSGTIVKYVWLENKDTLAAGSNSKDSVTLGIGVHNVKLIIYTSKGDSAIGTVVINILPLSLSYKKPVTVSSTDGQPAASAVDGDESTRWSSAYSDNQWINIDLGKPYNITDISVLWETASAKSYKIEESNDAIDWTPVITKFDMPTGGRTDSINGLTGGARYIRLFGFTRTSSWGFSIFELSVQGSANPDAIPIAEDSIHISSIAVSQKTISMEVGAKTNISAIVKPVWATDLKYSFSVLDTAIADFDSSKYLVAKKIGFTKVIAIAEDGSGVLKDTCIVEVKAAVGILNLKELDLEIYPTVVEKGSNLHVLMNVANTSYLISVIDISGNTIAHLSSNKNNVDIAIDDNYRSGIYFVRIVSKNKVKVSRFMVK